MKSLVAGSVGELLEGWREDLGCEGRLLSWWVEGTCCTSQLACLPDVQASRRDKGWLQSEYNQNLYLRVHT